MQCKLVGQTCHLLARLLSVGVSPLEDGVGLLADLVGVLVTLTAQALSMLQHSVDLLIVSLHGGEESLVTFHQVLHLLQACGLLVLGEVVFLAA